MADKILIRKGFLQNTVWLNHIAMNVSNKAHNQQHMANIF